MDETLLRVKDLRVSYHTYAGEVQSVRGISFDVNRGETLAIVGESGCGKSVTAKSIMGLILNPGEVKKDSQILFEGRNILDMKKKEWRQYRGKQCSMIFQDALTSLNPTMKVGKQIAENLIIHGLADKAQAAAKAVDLLRRVGIPNPEVRAKEYPHQFSGGMRQRAMIAIALACGPKLLIADEPTTALDVTIQAQIIDLMKDLQRETGTAIILITHDLGVVARMADRIAVMYAGKIVEYGGARQVFYQPSHPYTWGLLGAMPNLIQDVKSELYAIPGTPPDLYAPPKGCAFAARCPYAMGACLKEDPPEFVCGQGHGSRCWLLDRRAPDVTPPEGIPPLPKGGNSHV